MLPVHEFTQEHEAAWEVFEAAIIAAIFSLLFLGYHEVEIVASLASHILPISSWDYCW
jgi:hypothetical protein